MSSNSLHPAHSRKISLGLSHCSWPSFPSSGARGRSAARHSQRARTPIPRDQASDGILLCKSGGGEVVRTPSVVACCNEQSRRQYHMYRMRARWHPLRQLRGAYRTQGQSSPFADGTISLDWCGNGSQIFQVSCKDQKELENEQSQELNRAAGAGMPKSWLPVRATNRDTGELLLF
jgi:hypothetical protein